MDKQEAEQKKIEAVIEGARAEALEFAKGKTVAELTESLVDLYFHLYAEREQSRFAIRISECTAAILDGAHKQLRDAGIEPDKSIALKQKWLLDAEVAEHTALMMKLQERAERFAADEAKEEVLKPRNEGLKSGRKKSAESRAVRATASHEKLREAVFNLYRRNGSPDLSLAGWKMSKVEAVADYLSRHGFGAASTIAKKIGPIIREAKTPK